MAQRQAAQTQSGPEPQAGDPLPMHAAAQPAQPWRQPAYLRERLRAGLAGDLQADMVCTCWRGHRTAEQRHTQSRQRMADSKPSGCRSRAHLLRPRLRLRLRLRLRPPRAGEREGERERPCSREH